MQFWVISWSFFPSTLKTTKFTNFHRPRSVFRLARHWKAYPIFPKLSKTVRTLWQFSKTNCATSYGHGWRNDVVNQCLEAVHVADRMKLHTAENTAHCCHSLRNTKWVLLVLQYLFITLLYCNKQNFSLKPEVIPGYTLNGSTISFLQKQNVHTDGNKCMKNTHTHRCKH